MLSQRFDYLSKGGKYFLLLSQSSRVTVFVRHKAVERLRRLCCRYQVTLHCQRHARLVEDTNETHPRDSRIEDTKGRGVVTRRGMY